MGSHTLNQELQCGMIYGVRKCCEYVVIVPASTDVC